MKILAIESSHDDTSICLYENRQIIEEFSSTQTSIHKKFGGTVPELASRNHFFTFQDFLNKINHKYDLSTIDHIAYTAKPGLIGSLHMGQIFAKTLGLCFEKDVVPINHMHGHIFAINFNHNIQYPALALIVSGGHSQIWLLLSHKEEDLTIIGETKDDAIGEVFDKIARKMGVGYPGGPIIDELAKESNNPVDFYINPLPNFDFSFSGLKTKVTNYLNNQKKQVINADVAKGFQNAAIQVLMAQMKKAIKIHQPKSIILGGGVSANTQLREEFINLHSCSLIPELRYTTDNAAMIAITSHIQKRWEDFND